LVAVADSDPQRRAGRGGAGGNFDTGAKSDFLFDPREVRAFEDPRELIADPQVDLVSICTPTATHVDLAIAALAAGKHVLVEKPLGLSSASLQRLADAAAASQRLCMPAMCMRFWPGWDWLREHVRRGTFGPVRSAVFSRLGTRPGWNPAFYQDAGQSGGALFDLHIHDVDFICWLFGDPAAVTSAGSSRHLTTLYHFEASTSEGAAPGHVVAEGGWCLDPAAGFRMQYTVCFEGGTAEFDLGRAPQLLLHRDGASDAIELPSITGYEGEVAAAVTAIATGDRHELPTIADALRVTRVLEAERTSARSGRRVVCEGA
jgi:predicted dehydrogenase